MAIGRVLVRKGSQKVPHIVVVQAAPLMQYIETNRFVKICVHVCVCMCVFCNMLESLNVKSVTSRGVCCRSQYCITIYIFVQGNNFKMTLISMCTYLQRWGGKTVWWRETVQEQDENCWKRKDPSASPKLLFFTMSSKCSSCLFFLPVFSWLWLSLLFLLEHKQCRQKILNVYEYHCACVVCIAVNRIICNAANCWVFNELTKLAEYHAVVGMKTENRFLDVNVETSGNLLKFQRCFCVYV